MIESPWFPLAYQYLIGGVVFSLSIILAIKKRALKLELKKDKRIFFQLIVGFFIYLTMHIIITIASGA
ncbi:MAG: hypothetical protein GY754_30445 [bacterium]|nr:hypothetical protein [bacterium]